MSDLARSLPARCQTHEPRAATLAREPYEVACLEGPTNARTLARLRRVLQSDAFRSGVAALGGYHTERSGTERRVA